MEANFNIPIRNRSILKLRNILIKRFLEAVFRAAFPATLQGIEAGPAYVVFLGSRVEFLYIFAVVI